MIVERPLKKPKGQELHHPIGINVAVRPDSYTTPRLVKP
jgi:hypothetical protein